MEIVGGRSEASRRLSKNSAFGRQVLTQSARKIRPKVDAIGKDAVKRAEDKIASLYVSRAGVPYRHKDGAIPLAGSMRHRIERSTEAGSPTFPYRVVLYSEADVKQVMSLNYGARPHKITPFKARAIVYPRMGAEWRKAKITGPGEKRVVVKDRFKQSASAGRYLGQVTRSTYTSGRRAGRSRWDGLVAVRYVSHPGVSASYFMQLALERAVVVHLRKSVLLERTNT